MEKLNCKACGSSYIKIEGNILTCESCDSVFAREPENPGSQAQASTPQPRREAERAPESPPPRQYVVTPSNVPKPKKKRRVWLWVAGIVVALGLAGYFFFVASPFPELHRELRAGLNEEFGSTFRDVELTASQLHDGRVVIRANFTMPLRDFQETVISARNIILAAVDDGEYDWLELFISQYVDGRRRWMFRTTPIQDASSTGRVFFFCHERAETHSSELIELTEIQRAVDRILSELPPVS